MGKKKRVIKRATEKQIKSRLNMAYRTMLGGLDDGEQVSPEMLKELGTLIQFDLINISSYGVHDLVDSIDDRKALILEGRRQVVSYMLRQLDITPRELQELINDAILQNENTIESGFSE